MKIEDVRVGMQVKTKHGIGVIKRTLVPEGLVEVGVNGFLYGLCAENISICDDYATLRTILDEALTRASEGKGKDRHANGKPFDEQPIVTLNLSLGSQDGPLFQIMKKCQEASKFYASGERERAENELLDCIVYAAGAVITGRKRQNGDSK